MWRLTISVSPTRNRWKTLNGSDFRTIRFGADNCHARPSGYLSMSAFSYRTVPREDMAVIPPTVKAQAIEAQSTVRISQADSPRDLLRRSVCRPFVLYRLHRRDVRLFDEVTDCLCMSEGGVSSVGALTDSDPTKKLLETSQQLTLLNPSLGM